MCPYCSLLFILGLAHWWSREPSSAIRFLRQDPSFKKRSTSMERYQIIKEKLIIKKPTGKKVGGRWSIKSLVEVSVTWVTDAVQVSVLRTQQHRGSGCSTRDLCLATGLFRCEPRSRCVCQEIIAGSFKL